MARTARRRAGVLQIDIATRAGTTDATISRFENGVAWPLKVDIDSLIDAYADELGVQPWKLWYDALQRWAATGGEA